MSNPSKNKGTATETAVVRFLTERGIAAKRETLHGNKDHGDVHIWAGKIVVEVKARAGWHSPADIERWMAELERECMNVPQCSVGVLIVKRPGSGAANAGDWFAYLRSDEWSLLMSNPDTKYVLPSMRSGPTADLAAEWVCVNLVHLAAVLAALPAGVLP
jgi:hypothetical protein